MDLFSQVESIIDEEMPLYSNLANAAAVIYFGIKNTSWAGFYLSDEKRENLYLSSFQGPLACMKIPFGKGVCGTAACEKKSQLVPNVLEFKGHIACSSLSRSEVVVPILKGEDVLGVIDLDSNDFDNFTPDDVSQLEKIASLFARLF